ncbi:MULTISPECIES: type III secretion system protein SctP [unclassified Duganella]|uniref:type III secretion system protein SctP n=1 Tax=unclassified Duganella TaxID=2636909 RepID=UPI000E342B32|nr:MULTISPECIES: type III secretion system protein SctP [unclassified Duganella]RFP09349.1 hypothetical protein D0T23_26970 [Duganella sp. BJB475]RFP25385.1 hypothetical protein D0T21_28000 [Duganella sp. BJB476]
MSTSPIKPQAVRLAQRNTQPPQRLARTHALAARFAARYHECEPAPPAPARADGDAAPETGDGEAVASIAADAAGVAAAAAVTTSMPLGERIARACLDGQHGELMTAHLAALVARFCNAPAVSAGGGWELQIDINPAILAETRLYLQLSAFRLSLRFETPDPRAQRLICDHSAELCRRLRAQLQGQLDVTVTCW